jgi:hypothetical protein
MPEGEVRKDSSVIAYCAATTKEISCEFVSK